MYAIAEQVRTWLAAGHDVRIARVVATQGFSSRDHSAALAWYDDEPPAGSLLDGVVARPLDGLGLVELTVTDADAQAVGLSCGGFASVLVQPAAAYPTELWDRLVAREPLCVTTTIAAGVPVDTSVFTTATIRDAHQFGEQVAKLFGRGTSITAVLEGDDSAGVVVCLWPVPTLVMIGDGLIAKALADTAALLGWPASVTVDVDEAVAAAAQLQRSDAYVVLSHDRALDGPALAAALAGRAGYVGALGSRRTQALRREWLTEHGVDVADQNRIHGPAGLDIDAHTPAEIAISIVAEILANRTEPTTR